MRALPLLITSALLATPVLAEKPTPEVLLAQDVSLTYDADTYRFGDVYRSERGTTPDACAQLCNSETACVSWNLVPATFRMGPRCELKASPGAASYRPGAASGMSHVWQMSPDRHSEMRYQTTTPASRQPEAVPLDQLRPSPVPRSFGEPLPAPVPELEGGPDSHAALAPSPVPATPTQTPVTVTEVPAVTEAQAAPELQVATEVEADPHPLYRQPRRAAAPTSFRDPSRASAPATPVNSTYNAVERRQSQPAAAPADAVDGVADAGS